MLLLSVKQMDEAVTKNNLQRLFFWKIDPPLVHVVIAME